MAGDQPVSGTCVQETHVETPQPEDLKSGLLGPALQKARKEEVQAGW